MDMDVLYDTVMGIDVHQAQLSCCIVRNVDGNIVTDRKTFKTYGKDLHEMAEWAKSSDVDLVVMESTGIYWKTPYEKLESVGIKSAVVNARQVKQMEGKKTDMGDAEWLAHIGRLGAFSRSFIPDVVYRELRIPSREALKLTDDYSAEKNRFGKILNDCGFRLNLVFSDIFGVNATIAINALIDGKSVDEIIAMIDLGRLKKSEEEIRAALDGHLSESHCITLQGIRNHMNFLNTQIADLRAFMKKKIEELNPHALEFLQTIPGISEQSAVQILIELGGEDMTPFKTADRLASWIGVCPGNNESAGKRKHGHIRKGNYYLRRILCECATAAVRTKGTTFQSKYNALKIRKGYKRSLIAIVHKMVLCIFCVLSRREGYRDPKIDYDAECTKKNAKRWIRKLVKTEGWNVVATNTTTGEIYSSNAEQHA